jgi:hypothetical protein
MHVTEDDHAEILRMARLRRVGLYARLVDPDPPPRDQTIPEWWPPFGIMMPADEEGLRYFFREGGALHLAALDLLRDVLAWAEGSGLDPAEFWRAFVQSIEEIDGMQGPT